jgi:glycerol-3-phosphate acyltransferase PlsY
VFGVVGGAAVIALHHANIRRLFAGTEHRFRLRRAAPGPR